MSSTIMLDSAGPVNVLDFGLFLDGSHKQEVAEAIISSFKKIGFVCLINHGLSKEKTEAMFDLVIEFMSLFLCCMLTYICSQRDSSHNRPISRC